MVAPPSRPFEVRLDIPVRTYDIDFAGVVSNIVYIRWLEDLGLQILAEYFPLEQAMREQGISPVLLRTSIDYRQPIRIFDQVVGRMWVQKLGRARMVLKAEFVVDGQVRAIAEQSGCFIDFSTGKPVPMPQDIRLQFTGSP